MNPLFLNSDAKFTRFLNDLSNTSFESTAQCIIVILAGN